MTSNTVHMLSVGEYSDYRIIGILTNIEKAKKLAEKINSRGPYEHARVESVILNKLSEKV